MSGCSCISGRTGYSVRCPCACTRRPQRFRICLPAPLRAPALEAAAMLEPRLPGGEVYTDDRAPVEWLVDESLLEYANDD